MAERSLDLGALQGLLAQVHELKVACVGDLMLDRYVYGEVSRISPEAPIPVLRARRTVAMPGGVGNVARNVAALGGYARLRVNTARRSSWTPRGVISPAMGRSI